MESHPARWGFQYHPTDTLSALASYLPCCTCRRWEQSGFFAPDPDATGPPFTLPMPPPNVTGKLHMGHAMFVTLQVGEAAGASFIEAGSWGPQAGVCDW